MKWHHPILAAKYSSIPLLLLPELTLESSKDKPLLYGKSKPSYKSADKTKLNNMKKRRNIVTFLISIIKPLIVCA